MIESGIGNCVMLTPLIKSLHKLYTKPKITLLSSRYRKEGKILEGWKYLKDCIYSANDLKHEDFDKILVSPMYGSIFNYFLNIIPQNKIVRIDCNKMTDWFREHEVDVNMKIARELGYNEKTPSTEVMTKDVKISLNKKKLKVGFHTGCLNHPDYAKKLWVNERWDELAKRLEKEFNAQIIWFGSKDKPYPDKIHEGDYSGKIGMDLVGKFEDIRETAYMISKCNLFITLDSGLMHISDALKVPTIALFGPTLLSKNHPWNNSDIIQSKDCKECYYTELFKTCKDNKCMKEITVENILNVRLKMKKTIKIYLVACRQLGDTLRRTLSNMPNLKFIYYDYVNMRHDFSKEANDCDLLLVLKGINGVNIEYLKKVTIKKVLWFNDNICRYRNEFDKFKIYFDKIFTINRDEEPNTGFVPCGIDDTQFFDLKLNRDIDINFVGHINSKEREKWLKDIKSKIKLEHYQGISYDIYSNILNRSKITINQHYNECGANMRFYEAIACKSLMITDKVKGIPSDFEEGKHYLTYEDVPDLIKKIKYYLKNESKRLEITETAYNTAMRYHRYADRINEILVKSSNGVL